MSCRRTQSPVSLLAVRACACHLHALKHGHAALCLQINNNRIPLTDNKIIEEVRVGVLLMAFFGVGGACQVQWPRAHTEQQQQQEPLTSSSVHWSRIKEQAEPSCIPAQHPSFAAASAHHHHLEMRQPAAHMRLCAQRVRSDSGSSRQQRTACAGRGSLAHLRQQGCGPHLECCKPQPVPAAAGGAAAAADSKI